MEMIETTVNDLSRDLAWEVHSEVIAGKRQAAMGLYEMARALKRMRDERLYEGLGYDDFASYCNQLAKVNASQAYKYIKVYEELGATVLQSAGGLGIEKLFLVSQMPFDEKNEALADTEKIEGMSVSELKAFIAEARGHVEQISFLTEEVAAKNEEIGELKEQLEAAEVAEDDASEKETERIEAFRHEYEEKLKEAREAADSARVIAVDAARKQMDADYKEKIAKLKADHAAELKQAQANLDEGVREQIAAEAKEAAEANAKAELDRLRGAVENAAREKSELERQLKLSDSVTVTVGLYMTAIQENYNKLISFISTLEGDQSARCKSAARKMVAALSETTEKLMGDPS